MITGNSGLARRDLPDYLKAAAAWEHYVEQDEIEIACDCQTFTLMAVGPSSVAKPSERIARSRNRAIPGSSSMIEDPRLFDPGRPRLNSRLH